MPASGRRLHDASSASPRPSLSSAPLDGLAQCLPGLWYRPRLAWPLWPLLPLSWLFRGVVALRRALFRRGILASRPLAVPVIVVGNLTVGGSGKTPFVIWLVGQLRARGWRPGIVSRGYGGDYGEECAAAEGILAVSPDTPAALAGDEPVLLARRCRAPVYVGRDRTAAGEALLAANPHCDVIVADDGLQHYRLRRCVEIAVFDGRGVGNGHLLPVGPLREPLARLRETTAIVWNSTLECRAPVPGGDEAPGRRAPVSEGCDSGAARHFAGLAQPRFAMHLVAGEFYALKDPALRCAAAALRGKRLHAVAGIGDPRRFFEQLTALGLEFSEHPFPDHHRYTPADLDIAEDGVLLMTEKDAVKCAALPVREAWVLPVEARFDAARASALLELIVEKLDGCAPA